jgi:hypothetical protein
MTQMAKQEFSEEEIEEILDMHAPDDRFSMQEARETIKEHPLLVAGLLFAFGILVGASLCSSRRKS